MNNDLDDITSDIKGNPVIDLTIDSVNQEEPPHYSDEESALGSGVETGNHQNTSDLVESMIGNEPSGTLAEEVAHDEAKRRGVDPDELLESIANAPNDTSHLPEIDANPYTDTDSSPPDDKQ